MKRTCFCTLTFLIMLTFPATLFAQSLLTTEEASGEMKKIMLAYQPEGLLRISIYSSLYMSDNPRKKIDSMFGSYFIQGNNVFANLNRNISYLQNGKWAITVFDETKEMYVDTVQSDSKWDPKANPLKIVDSIHFDTTAVYYAGNRAGSDTNMLKAVFQPGGELKEAKILYRKSDYHIILAEYKMPVPEEILSDTAGITHHQNNSNRQYILKMLFKESWPDEPSATLFSEKKYFLFNDGQMTPTDKYKDYRLLSKFTDSQ